MNTQCQLRRTLTLKNLHLLIIQFCSLNRKSKQSANSLAKFKQNGKINLFFFNFQLEAQKRGKKKDSSSRWRTTSRIRTVPGFWQGWHSPCHASPQLQAQPSWVEAYTACTQWSCWLPSASAACCTGGTPQQSAMSKWTSINITDFRNTLDGLGGWGGGIWKT